MEVRTNKRTNIRTDEWKDENYIPLGINAGGIIKSGNTCISLTNNGVLIVLRNKELTTISTVPFGESSLMAAEYIFDGWKTGDLSFSSSTEIITSQFA